MNPARKRRWLRVALIAVAIGVIGGLCWTKIRVNDRMRLAHSLPSRGVLMGELESDNPVARMPLLWETFGAHPVGLIVLPEGQFTDDEVAWITKLFPEATIQYHAVRMDMPSMGTGFH